MKGVGENGDAVGQGGERELTVSRPRVKVPTNFRPLIGHTIVGGRLMCQATVVLV